MQSLICQRTGPLTRELLREPGGFGLGQVPAKQKPDATTTSICGYCSTGCGLNVHLKDGEAVGLSPTVDYPVNLGMACPKGWEALAVLDSPERATVPLLRNDRGKLVPTDWDTALRTFTERVKSIQRQHGNDSVAFLGTGQLPTEELALLGALAKFGMGMLHGDGNTRQCMATSVVAYKQAFGFDAPPYTYADFEASDVIVLVGSNLCIAHPILWERVLRNPHRPEIVVLDPRMTETAMQATQHLPLAPKSDQTLLYGIARILIENGWIDREFIDAHTTGFDEFAQFVRQFPLDRVVAEVNGMTFGQSDNRTIGPSDNRSEQFPLSDRPIVRQSSYRIDAADVERLARTIHDGRRVSFWWTMGVNQSYQGVRTAQAIINLALMTGNIGRPGTGANSITGQCNAMGSRLFSNTTNLLGGHDFTNAGHRTKIARALNIDVATIPTENSWAYHEIFEGILRGKIKGLWVVCTNPAHSWINQSQARDILERLDFLVVQDMYHTTETARMAHLVLPAAGWGEKDGTFINSARRIGVIKKVKKAPGQALADFAIFRLVAEYWGCGEMFAEWNSPEAVFQILKRCTAGQPCDITGIEDYAMLDRSGGIQWPFLDRGLRIADCSAKSISHYNPKSHERRLFEDGRFFHADSRARFLFEAPQPLSEPPSRRFPFILLTGRGTASQWHTQTRTRQSAVLRKLYPLNPFVEVNPADARALRIVQNGRVIVESQRGRLVASAFLTHAVRRGQVFIPMHYEETNRLTDAVFDPYSKQPSYKSCAVRLVPA